MDLHYGGELKIERFDDQCHIGFLIDGKWIAAFAITDAECDTAADDLRRIATAIRAIPKHPTE